MNTDLIKETIRNKDIPDDTKAKALAEIDEIVKMPKCVFNPEQRSIYNAFHWHSTPSGYNFWHDINDAPDLLGKPKIESETMRKFGSGATRSSDRDKLDFEGFLSPLVLVRYAKYLHKHRVQADGELRDSDNWQRGIPIKEYMKSKWRHFMSTWSDYRAGLTEQQDIQESLCAELFNTMGMLHEILKGKR